MSSEVFTDYEGLEGGWRIDQEDFQNLDQNFNFENEVLLMMGDYEANDFDARDILKVENQRSQGACQGHSISSCVEMASCIAIGENPWNCLVLWVIMKLKD